MDRSSKRYTEGCQSDAVSQVVERRYSVAELASRLGMTNHSLYAWKMKYGPDSPEHQERTAVENSGEQAIDSVHSEALATFCQPVGNFVIGTTFKCLLARA